ncbi:MAG: GyrI-like domain-containing protein [Christensenellales bacterium]
MDYRIEKRDAFEVLCKRKRVGKPQTANATPDITALWKEYGADGTMEKLIACMPENPVMKGLLGICFSAELDAKQFPTASAWNMTAQKQPRAGGDSSGEYLCGDTNRERCRMRLWRPMQECEFSAEHAI